MNAVAKRTLEVAFNSFTDRQLALLIWNLTHGAQCHEGVFIARDAAGNICGGCPATLATSKFNSRRWARFGEAGPKNANKVFNKMERALLKRNEAADDVYSDIDSALGHTPSAVVLSVARKVFNERTNKRIERLVNAA